MPPSTFHNKSTECSDQSHLVEGHNNENESRRSGVWWRSDRSNKGPIAPVVDEYDTFAKVVSRTWEEDSNLIGPSRTKKVVSFSQTVDFLPVLHLKDMTDQEVFDMWWAPRDYAVIRKMIQITLKQLQITGCDIDEDDRDFCSRGIERYLKNSSLRREERKRAALEGVLKCQDHQKRWMGYVDSTFIAQVYSALCLPDRVTAIAIGESDAADAAATKFRDRCFGSNE